MRRGKSKVVRSAGGECRLAPYGQNNTDHDIELQVLRGISENHKQFEAILLRSISNLDADY